MNKNPQRAGLLPLNSVWCIDDFAFAQVLNALSCLNLADFAARGLGLRRNAGLPMTVSNGVAVIDIEGVLVRRPTILGFLFAQTVYGDIEAAVEDAARREDVRAIVLRIDSPGGEAYGVAEAGDAIFVARSFKPVAAQVSGVCCSAAYWLASQADTIHAGRQDRVGCIGTRILLYDRSVQFALAGVEAVAIDTGKFKSTGAEGKEITAEEREYLQAYVDGLQREFTLAVRLGRGLTPGQLQAVSDARVFLAPDAVKAGLIDGIATERQTLARFAPRPKQPWEMSATELQAEWDLAVKACTAAVDRRFYGDARSKLGEEAARQKHGRLFQELQQRQRGTPARAPVVDSPPPAEPSAIDRVAALVSERMRSLGEDRRTALHAVLRSGGGEFHRRWLAEMNAHKPSAVSQLLG